MGLTFPNVLGLAAGLRQERRRHRRARRARASGTSRSARSPASRSRATRSRGCSGCPRTGRVVNRMGFNNDGAEVVARRLRPQRPRGPPSRGPVLGVNIGKTKVVPEDDEAAVRRLRAERPAARAVRRLPGRQRQLAEHPRPAQPAGRREAAAAARARPRGPPTGGRRPPGAAAGEDRARPRRRRRARRRRPGHRDRPRRRSSPPTPRSPATAWPRRPAQVEALGAGGLSGAPLDRRARSTCCGCCATGSATASTLIGVGGIATVDDARARLDAGADLLQGYTGVHLRGAGVAPPDPA